MSSNSKILVWDVPTRVFHWSLVICFLGALLTKDSERWRLLHVNFGYTMMGLVCWRLIWGVFGSRYAKFSEFIKPPSEIKAYIQSLLTNNPKHYVGHNPVGAIAIVLVLALVLLLTISGYLSYNDLGGEWPERLHDEVSDLLVLVCFIHFCGVVASSYLHKESLIKSMLTGMKDGLQSDKISSAYLGLGAVLILAIALFWWIQFL